jgi:DNA-binding HxlR family transcriptional regulator
MDDRTIILDSEAPTIAACTQYSAAMDDALYAIGGKWKLKVITALLDKPKRFNELQRAVKGISATVLSHELKELELNEFIKREINDTAPVNVEYRLTDYSYTLKEVVVALSKWGIIHREMIRKRKS